jgi:hypothetical protein
MKELRNSQQNYVKRDGVCGRVLLSQLLGFWTFSIVQNSKYYKTQHFGNCIYFLSWVGVGVGDTY